jgi:hypothetical protein
LSNEFVVAMVFQRVQDRALVGWPSGSARRGEALEGALQALEIADPLLDELDLLSGLLLDHVARRAVPDPQAEQLLDFLQRKAELPGVFDEAQATHRVRRVRAISRWRAARSGE